MTSTHTSSQYAEKMIGTIASLEFERNAEGQRETCFGPASSRSSAWGSARRATTSTPSLVSPPRTAAAPRSAG